MMIENLAKNLVELKKNFVGNYHGNSQVKEVIPNLKSDSFPVEQSHLELLHQFAKKNPIYYNSFDETIGDVPCTIYEGDFNRYWLNSIQHGSSNAPFSPTWIFSAYLSVLSAKNLGFEEVIDIGSGDGRIAFCAKILDFESYSIEIDDSLVDLQKLLTTTLNFHPNCSDALVFDYAALNLNNPIFFIGGLAQMGGSQLASGVIDKINCISLKNSGWVFAGTYSQKYQPDPKNYAGWGTLLEQNNMTPIQTIVLPTAWTFNEKEDTPYVFAEMTSE